METYARGIPTYKGENGQTIGLLCETKEQCITDDNGVRLSDKLQSMQEQISTGPDFTELSTHANNETIHITAAERTTWNGKVSRDELQTAIDGITNVPKTTNADTVNGYEAWQMQNVDEDGSKINNYLFSQYTAATNAFHLKSSQSGIATSVDHANNADTLDGYHANSFFEKIGGTINGDLSIEKDMPISWLKNTSVSKKGKLERGTNYSAIVNYDTTDGNIYSALLLVDRENFDGEDCLQFEPRNNTRRTVLHTGISAPCVVVASDPGIGTSVSYANGTLLFVKGA